MTTRCPRCETLLIKSPDVIPGHIVNRCVACKRLNVENSDFWPTYTDDMSLEQRRQLQAQLINHALRVEEEDALYREARTWKEGDPKWSLLELFR
jgi:phage FluMu protein Com